MAKDTFFKVKHTLNAGGKLLDLSTPLVMGILNITPDSFYDGGRFNTIEAAIKQTEKMLNEGATIIDIGAASSKPNVKIISAEEEKKRLLEVVLEVKKCFPEAVLSVDAFHADIAEAAINAGAHIINDISAGELDKQMFDVVAGLQVPYIMMHMRGTPQTMQSLTDYDDLILEIKTYFSEKIDLLRQKGVHDLVLDAGFGFAKTIDQNYLLMGRLNELQHFGLPVLTGISRKSMIWKVAETDAENALNATSAMHMTALELGSKILRVHDVKAAKEVIKIYKKLHAN